MRQRIAEQLAAVQAGVHRIRLLLDEESGTDQALAEITSTQATLEQLARAVLTTYGYEYPSDLSRGAMRVELERTLQQLAGAVYAARPS
jgi:hypothetical protein